MFYSKIGFVPLMSAILAQFLSDSAVETRLKIATLFYERVIFPVSKSELQVFARVKSELSGVNEEILLSTWSSLEDVAAELVSQGMLKKIYDPRRDGIWDKKGHIRRGLRSAAMETMNELNGLSRYKMNKIKQSHPYEYFYYTVDAGKVAVAAVGSAELWIALQSYLYCSFAAFSSAELFAAQSLITQRTAHTKGTVQNTQEFLKRIEAFVPFIGDLSWDAVFYLREDKRISAFRTWISDSLSNENSSQNASDDSAIEGLWQAVHEFKPNPVSSIFQAIIGNVPLPIPINPAGLFLSGREVAKTQRLNKQYAWLLFLHSMKSASRKK